MTKRIQDSFTRLKRDKSKGFIAYVTAGDPSLDETVEIAELLADSGVDLIELGIPFSDPLADGRVNQEAAERALAAGATWTGVLRSVEEIRKKVDLPIIFFSYLNPLYAVGFDSAMKSATSAGVDGILLLDMPIEESSTFDETMRASHLDKIPLITPTTPPERMSRILESASGFVYCVSRTGVTGEQAQIEASADALIDETRRHTQLPIALGFGISNQEQAAEAAQFADAVVVGSAIVKRFHTEDRNAAGRRSAARWVAGLVQAVKEI